MRAIVLRGFGGPERLERAEIDEPAVEPGRVLVAVRAVGVNFADVLVRAGRYPQPPELPNVPGNELAGEVVAVGPGVSGPRPGDRVMAITDGAGAYAERATVAADSVFPLPVGPSFAEGASFSVTFLTAYLSLVRRLRVGPAQTVLVHAAAGGVGTAALQLLRHLGATAIATASSAEKLAVAERFGAAVGIDYTREDLVERVREATGGRGVDVVLDTVGGAVFEQSLRVLAPLGTLVAIGFAGGDWPEVSPSFLVARNIGVVGFYLGRLLRLEPELTRAAARELAELWRSGAVAPLVGAELPLEQAAAAHRLIEERRSTGKVVLLVDGG